MDFDINGNSQMVTEQGKQHEQKSEMALLKCGGAGKDWVKWVKKNQEWH